jgi:hypothetical protein
MNELDSFVESTVLALSVDPRNHELRLEASCPFRGKARKTIVATGIDELLIDDLRIYNIIDRVTVFDATDAVEEINDCTRSLFYLMQKRELSVSDFTWPALKEKLTLIRTGQSQLMEIEPVAGESITVLAKRIEIA